MDKELGQEYKNPIQREAFLKDNCELRTKGLHEAIQPGRIARA